MKTRGIKFRSQIRPILPLVCSRRRSNPNTVAGGFANPDQYPKLRTFRLFKTSFGTSAYLDCGPYYLRPALLRFRCSNHRLDIELGRHNNVPRQDRSCRFCKTPSIGDEFHAFKCAAFMDLQVLCDVNVQSYPQFIAAMQSFEIRTQRYLSLVMSRIRLR